MRRTGRQRWTIGPFAAVVMLLVCGGIAFFSLRSTFGRGAAPIQLPDIIVGDELAPGSGEAAPPGRDLLAAHGSWGGGQPVRCAFAALGEPAPLAAPMGESGAPAAAPWVGADPPALRLGVVPAGGGVRRAVLGGRVVGVGESVGSVQVVAIERDHVVVTWDGRLLTYDLEGDHPREFRAEIARRRAARTDGREEGR
jgi:hypothetical protein